MKGVKEGRQAVSGSRDLLLVLSPLYAAILPEGIKKQKLKNERASERANERTSERTECLSSNNFMRLNE
jgi:hypothetical protein